MRVAALISHPIQYYTPIFRLLAQKCDLHVFFGQALTPDQQAAAGFQTRFDWDIDLLSGYQFTILNNVSSDPGPHHFCGCDTPEIGERLRDGRFDALLVMGWYLKSHVQAIFAAKARRIPVLIRGDSQLNTPRSWLRRAAKKALFPHLLRRFDAALAVGTRNRAYLEHYGYPEDRIFASPHCVATDWFAERATPQARHDLRRRLGIATETPVALFAGKLIDFKRPADAVAATAHARSQGVPVELLVAGSGPLESDLRALAAALEVPLHMLGFCNQTEMPAAYAAADILVLPSTGRETWGLVANEALACGCPVLLSDAVGCAPDLAADGHVGRTFPLGDPIACGDAMAAALGERISREAVAAVSNAFSIDAAVSGIVEALRATKRL